MRIVCVIGGFAFGGAERVMTNLVNYLSREHEVCFVAVHHRDTVAYPIDERVHTVNGIGFQSKLTAHKALRKTILGFKPDVVLSFLTHINVLTLMAMRGTGIPVYVSERNDPAKTGVGYLRILRKLLYPHARGVVFQTKDAQSYFPEKIRKRSTVIPNPIFVSEEYLTQVKGERPHELVAVGRLTEQKNYPLLLSAFEEIAADYPDWILKIYGDGHLRETMEARIREKGLEDRILLCGQRKDLHACIRNSRIFVMTSDFEGMPNALMEAMALGLCCISADCPVGGPRELIRDGQNGALFPVGDKDRLVALMRHYMDRPKEAERVGERARAIMDTMNTSVICKKWEDFLKGDVRDEQ